MKIFKVLLVVFSLTCYSCQEVVEIDLNTAAPKLVVDATILGGTNNNCLYLSTTTAYFDTEIPVVTTADVNIIDEDGTMYSFQHTEEGTYCGEFLPEENMDYTLRIIYEGEIYTATTQLVSTVPFELVEQENNGGFSGDEIEVRAHFTDPADETNFYFLEAISTRANRYDVINDQFSNGNTVSYSFSHDELVPGDTVTFNLYGINEQTYTYLYTLLQQRGNTSGPFGTQPATVRGNIVNQTNPENYPLGYFKISEFSRVTYTVQ